MKKQIRMIMVVAVSMLGVGTMLTTGCKSSENGSTKRTAGTYVDDSAITAKIKSKMIGDSVVKAHEINVDTFQGNVQLNGFVDNDQQKSRAEEIARNTSGVVNVQNNLQFVPKQLARAAPIIVATAVPKFRARLVAQKLKVA